MTSRLRTAMALLPLVLPACASAAPPEAQEPIEIGPPAAKLEGERYLEYRVGVNVAAPPEAVWKVLTDASAYAQWNSTVTKLDGTIAQGEQIELTSTLDPERTFELTVSTFEAPNRLVWQDGGKAFKGVRTFTLSSKGDGTTDVTMSEVMTGMFMNSIAPKLPDFRESFDAFAADLKTVAETSDPA